MHWGLGPGCEDRELGLARGGAAEEHRETSTRALSHQEEGRGPELRDNERPSMWHRGRGGAEENAERALEHKEGGCGN